MTEIEAHCPYFESYENAFTDVDVDAITVYASKDVIGSWSGHNVQPLEDSDPEKDETLLLSVEIGLIVMFSAIFVVTLLRKMRPGA